MSEQNQRKIFLTLVICASFIDCGKHPKETSSTSTASSVSLADPNKSHVSNNTSTPPKKTPVQDIPPVTDPTPPVNKEDAPAPQPTEKKSALLPQTPWEMRQA